MLHFRASPDGPKPAGARYAPVDHEALWEHGASPRRRRWPWPEIRARATTLSILLLSFFGACTLLREAATLFAPTLSIARTPPESGSADIASISPVVRISRPVSHTNLTHLVLVPCHSIFVGSDAGDRLDEESWVLANFQRGKGRPRSFWRHIAEGAKLVQEDPHALLIFSGGQTSARTITSEAESYYRLALLSGVFNSRPGSLAVDDTPTSSKDHAVSSQAIPPSPNPLPFDRATTEVFALDSFQNLLFSVTRFYELTGRYPEKITVVGYEMKRERFTSLHRRALRYPAAQFKYVGIDLDPDMDPEAWAGEVHNALEPYRLDLYGCHGILAKKRTGRNPHARVPPYGTLVLPATDALESEYLTPTLRFQAAKAAEKDERPLLAEQEMVRQLLNWCPPLERAREEYSGKLPWDN